MLNSCVKENMKNDSCLIVSKLIHPVNLNQMEVYLKRILRKRQLFVENIILKKEASSKLVPYVMK